MTRIKLCGLSRPCDIEAANELKPDYIGFVFASKSRRYVSPEKAAELKKLLHPDILAVGVFVNEEIRLIADLLNKGVIDVAQLHGREDEAYVRKLRSHTSKPLIQAFRIDTSENVETAQRASADFILLDSGEGGTGRPFNWELLQSIRRPYFLAGGLTPENVGDAVASLQPFGVDVSSGIETDGVKDKEKMTAFVAAVRKEG